MALNTINGDTHVAGTFTATSLQVSDGTVTNAKIASNAGIVRSKLAQEALAKFTIPLSDFRIWDAVNANLGATAVSDDDLAYVGGTFGSASPIVTTTDVVGTSKTRRARVFVTVPAEYDGSESLQIRLSAGIIGSNAAQVSCTIDVEAYLSNKAGGVGSDLCATAAASMNSTTFASYDFDITPAGIVAGDILDVRVTIAINDTGGAGACEGAIGSCELLCDIRG